MPAKKTAKTRKTAAGRSPESTSALPVELETPVPASPALLKKLQLPVTKTLEEHTDEIRSRLEGQARSAVEVALLIGTAKAKYFEGKYPEWTAWAREQFDYSKRYCNQLARACNFLVSRVESRPELLTVDIDKLYQVARLPEEKRDDFLAGHPDLFEKERREIRALVKQELPAKSNVKPSRPGRPASKFSAAKSKVRALKVSLKSHPSLLRILHELNAEMDRLDNQSKL